MRGVWKKVVASPSGLAPAGARRTACDRCCGMRVAVYRAACARTNVTLQHASTNRQDLHAAAC